FKPVARLRKIENHRDQNAKASEILQYFKQRPVAQAVCQPLKSPFQQPKRPRPRGLGANSSSKRVRPLARTLQDHVGSSPVVHYGYPLQSGPTHFILNSGAGLLADSQS